MNNDSDVRIKRLANGRFEVRLDPMGGGNSHTVTVDRLTIDAIEQAAKAHHERHNWSRGNREKTAEFINWMRSSNAVNQAFTRYTEGTDAALQARALESEARSATARATSRTTQRGITAAQRELDRVKAEIKRTQGLIAQLCGTPEGRVRNKDSCDRFDDRLVQLDGELTEAERVVSELTGSVATAREEAETFAADAAANREAERIAREQAALATTRMRDIRNNTSCCGDSKFQDRAVVARLGSDYCAGATSLNEYSSQAVLNQGGMAVNSNQAKWACNGIEKMCFGRARCAYISGETIIPFEGDVSCGFGAQGSCAQTTTCFRQNEGGIVQGNALDVLPAAGFQQRSASPSNSSSAAR
jgi:hypothetical protein